MPWLRSLQVNALPGLNPRLFQYWVEKASQQMSICQDQNPLSFTIIEHLNGAESIVHSVQAISAAHEVYFDPKKLLPSLEERSKALQKSRQELQTREPASIQSFITAYLLGISGPWIDHSQQVFGQEHFMAARTIFEALLAQPGFENHPLFSFAVGCFVYWDMGCSILINPDEQKPLETPAMQNAVARVGNSFHPLTNYSTELCYDLARLSRYCRWLATYSDISEHRDAAFEDAMEARLSARVVPDTLHDTSITHLNDAYRLYGLILLYRLCKRRYTAVAESAAKIDSILRTHAFVLLAHLDQITPSDAAFRFIGLPLLPAAAELRDEDSVVRERVLSRYAMLISVNRLPTYLWATQLLHELWELNDSLGGSDSVSWLHLMLEKGWRLDLS